MRRLSFLAVALASAPLVAQPAAPAPRHVVRAAIESSLPTAGGNIRQFAFDGDPKTGFASVGSPKAGDHLTLVFDAPVTLRSASLVTGRVDGTDTLPAAAWEVSTDGTKFTPAGLATGGYGGIQAHGPVRALRLRVNHDLTHPLVVREFTIDTEPKVVPFRHPIEFVLDVTDAPEMKAWGDKVVRVCEREYPDICTFLASDGYTPPTQLRMTLKSAYGGVAEAGGSPARSNTSRAAPTTSARWFMRPFTAFSSTRGAATPAGSSRGSPTTSASGGSSRGRPAD